MLARVSPIVALYAASLLGQAVTTPVAAPAPPSAPVPAPAPINVTPAATSGAGQFGLLGAIGSPTTPPRHAAAALGFSESVSSTQDFFFMIAEAPQPGNGAEQIGLMVGMTQSLPGTITIGGLTFHTFASAALGTSLKNVTKLNLATTPTAIVSSAATNASFTSEYVFGLGYQPAWCNRCELGPSARYVHITGEPSQTIVAIYFKWLPK